MRMIRTPSMSSEDLAARMPLPGNAAIVISTSTRYLDLIKRETVPLLCHLARGRFIVNEVSQAVSTCSSPLRAEFQEGAPSMRARLGRLWRECAIVTCRLARSCSPSRLRPITQTSALVAVDMRSDRHAHRRLWLRRWNDLWAQQHARVDCD